MVIGKRIGLICLVVILLSFLVLADNKTDYETIAEENSTNKTTIQESSNKTNKDSTKIPTLISAAKKISKKPVKDTCLYYFMGKGCTLCAETDQFINSLESKYPDLKIKKYEVYYNKTHRALLQDLLTAYGVDLNRQGIPIVFLPQSYLLGPKSITTYLEGTVNSNVDSSCPNIKTKEVIGIIGKQKSPKNLIETLTFGMVSTGAFENNLTTGALAIFAVLLILFLGIKTRRRLIGTGIAFTVAVYLAYLLAGLGIVTGITTNYHLYVGISALVISLWIFKKRFLPGLKIIPKIPHKIKKIFDRAIKVITFPAGAFIIGFIVTLFQISSNQGIYKTLVELAQEQATKNAALPLLLFHNFIFVLYLVAATILIGYSMKRKEAKKGKLDIPDGIENKGKTNIDSLHFVINLLIFILGLILVFFL